MLAAAGNSPRRTVQQYGRQVNGRLPPDSHARVLGNVLSDACPSLEEQQNPWRKFYDPEARIGVAG
jgi:hypothetical protein